MKNITLIFFSSLLLNISYAFSEEAWKLEKDKDGIKVWNRKTPNSSLKEFKVSTILQITPEKLIAFLKNTSKYDKWMYKVDAGSVKVLKKNNENDYYTYMTISAPLIKTRETITHMVFNPQDTKGTILINLDGAPDLLPLNDKYIRIQKMKAYFKIVPLGNGKVELIHQAYGSPGGGIPDVLANLSSVDCPFYMFTKIKELL
ncbi:MAG: hypothetical protein U0T69_04085 [Chitinophagales bacterium]